MSFVLDLVVIAVVALFIFIGLRRGFIKEIISLVALVVAFALAMILSGIGSSFIYDSFIDDYIKGTVSKPIIENVSNDAESIIVSIPDEFIDAGNLLGVEVETVVRTNMAESVKETADGIATTVSRDIARPIITSFIRVVLFIIIFVLVKLLIEWLGKILNIASHIPGLSSINKLLGGAVGLLRGMLTAAAICYAVVLIVDVRANGIFGITSKTVDESLIFSLFANIVR